VQLSLFSSKDRGKEKQLHDAMDKINTLMGRDKVRYAAAGISRKWKLRQEKKSPCYTTNVNELLRIKN
jgi:DNA polymerase V